MRLYTAKIKDKAKLQLTISMFLFGTIGIFRRYIPLPSDLIALVRGFVGMLFLLMVLVVTKKHISWKQIKKNGIYLILSGVLLGFNWILLFEAYRFTSVATATVCYYMAPVFVLLVSPFLLKEARSSKQTICIVMALLGMVLVSGVIPIGQTADAGNITKNGTIKGILLGLAAAVFYAGIVILNKKLKEISAYDRTIVQLGISAIVLLPYTLMQESETMLTFTPTIILLLAVVGIVHTGIAYTLYFGSMEYLKAQTVALFGYIDPIVAILLSTLFLKEKMDILEIIGAVMVLGATIWCETNKAPTSAGA